MKPIIIFDLDDTLIDTSRIRAEIVKLAQSLGVAKQRALKARAQVRSSSQPFTIQRYGAFLFPGDTIKHKSLIKKFNYIFGQKGFFNYPGVEAFLAELSKRYSLVLLTYGNSKLQKKKILQSGLSQFFWKILVTSDHTKTSVLRTFAQKYDNRILFIDNAKFTCDAACRMHVPTIWVTSKAKNERFYQKLELRIKRRMKAIWNTK